MGDDSARQAGSMFAGIDSVLFAVPNAAVGRQLAQAVSASGALLKLNALGLKLSCSGIDWRAIVRAAAERLPAAQRRDIRITTIPARSGPEAVQVAIFNARRLEEFLAQLSAEWLWEVMGRDALAIHFQPIVQHPPGRLLGYECLMRGIDPAGADIPPARMFDAARTLGLVAQLDERCRLAALLQAAALGLDKQLLFIKILPEAIYSADFSLDSTLAAMVELGLNPSRITFEAVGWEAVSDCNHLIEILNFLRAQGCKVALNAGSLSDSATADMADLRPDYVKLQIAPIRQPARANPAAGDGNALAALLTVAREHNVIPIASQIETEAQFRHVGAAGIRLSQGFFHAHPRPEALSQEQINAIVLRTRGVHRQTRAEPKARAGNPWDLSGLYQKLADLARQTSPGKPGSSKKSA